MKETNKLLADFLELEIITDGILFFDTNYKRLANYNSDWNQLMLVIEKIQEICAKNDDMEKFFLIKDEIPHLENTYDKCINFVKEYKNV